MRPQVRPSTKGATSGLNVSPDGRFLLSSDYTSGVLRVWDLVARIPVAEWVEDYDVVFGVEPATVLAADDEGLRCIDVHTGQARLLPWPHPRGQLLRGPGGSPWYLVTHKEAAKHLVDVATGALRCTLAAPTDDLGHAVLSPDGRWLATCTWTITGAPVRIWSVADGVQRHELPDAGSVSAVAFLPGHRCVVASDYADTTRVWDLARGAVIAELAGTEFALSPDGSLLAVAGAYQEEDAEEDAAEGVRIYSTASWESLVELPRHGEVGALVFTPDSEFLATGCDSDSIVRVWDAGTGRLAYELAGVTREVHALAFSPDGRRLASVADDSQVRVWETDTGNLAHRLPASLGVVSSVLYHPGGDRLTVADDMTVSFWDTTTGASLGALPSTGSAPLALAYSPDGGRLAVACEDGTLLIWDTRTWRVLHVLTGHRNSAWYVAFSPEGQYLVVADDTDVRTWDTTDGTLTGHLAEIQDRVDAVDVAPDGRGFAIGSCDEYDSATLSIYRAPGTSPATPYTETVRALAYAPDGALAVGSDHSTVHICTDPRSGEFNVWLEGHTGLVRSLAYSPDGRLLAVGGTNGSVHLWDPGTQRLLSVLVALDDGGSATLRGGAQHVVDGTPNGEFWYRR